MHMTWKHGATKRGCEVVQIVSAMRARGPWGRVDVRGEDRAHVEHGAHREAKAQQEGVEVDEHRADGGRISDAEGMAWLVDAQKKPVERKTDGFGRRD